MNHGTWSSVKKGCRCTECRQVYLDHYQRTIKYRREVSRTRSRERRKLLNSLKDKPCTDCGIKYNPWVMQFDHVRGVKKAHVNTLLTRKLSILMEEIAKCELVCSNCHAERTHSRGQNYNQKDEFLEREIK